MTDAPEKDTQSLAAQVREYLAAQEIAIPDGLEKDLDAVEKALQSSDEETHIREDVPEISVIRHLVAAAHMHNGETHSPSSRAKALCDKWLALRAEDIADCFSPDAAAAQKRPAWSHVKEQTDKLNMGLKSNLHAIDMTDGERPYFQAAFALSTQLSERVNAEGRSIKPELTVTIGDREVGGRPYATEIDNVPAEIARVWKAAAPMPLNTASIKFLQRYNKHQNEEDNDLSSRLELRALRMEDIPHQKLDEAIDRIITAKRLLHSLKKAYFNHPKYSRPVSDRLETLEDFLTNCHLYLAYCALPILLKPDASPAELRQSRQRFGIMHNTARDHLSQEVKDLIDSQCTRDTLWEAVQRNVADNLTAVSHEISRKSLGLPEIPEQQKHDPGMIIQEQILGLALASVEQAIQATNAAGPAIDRGPKVGRG